MLSISAIVLTKNSSKTLSQTLESLKHFKEIIVIDTGSTDNSKEITKTFPNTKLYEHTFSGFGGLRLTATEYATYPWIFSLDSDEILSKEASLALSLKTLSPNKVYSFPFHNYFNNRFIKWCGWYPDRHIRLFHKDHAKFSSDFVHEKVLYEGLTEEKLLTPIEHHSYKEISDFLDKMQRYSTLFAEQNRYKKTSSVSKAIVHGCFAFFKSYILKRGILGGNEGFIIALYNSQTSYYKYLKLWENNRDASCL
jgi:glycosyltransferase involved in cell wall biosynthesis